MTHGGSLPRILLLGATGQLGRELLVTLAPLGEITAAALDGSGAIRPLDLTDAAATRALIREIRPSLIVNAAAFTQVDQAERDPELAMAVNAALPGVLQEEANQLGAATVHYSTEYVFDGSGDRPWTETDAPAPLNAYGRSKLLGERNMAAAGGAFLILRTSWLFGRHGGNFVKTILQLAAERETLRVVDDQIGGPTSADYLAELTATILRESQGDFAGLLHERGGLFHACNAGFVSWCDFARTIVAEAIRAGLPLKATAVEPISSAEFPAVARRPQNSRLNCSRLRQEYRHSAPSWQEALARTLPNILHPQLAR
jgi:dTDP-4-dehydrorhamnose reductase